MKLSVCIDSIFRGKDFIESMNLIKNLGYNTIEFWNWWDKDIEKIIYEKERLGLDVAAICTKSISLVDVSKRDEYLIGLEDTIQVAKKLGCNKIITQAGDELKTITRAEQHKNLVETLKACREVLMNSNMKLLLEPLNTIVDHKGNYLYSSDEGFQIIDEIQSPNIKLLFDIYHLQIMEGNIISRIKANIDKIEHFHCAGNPGRHELDNGEINYTNVFDAIEKTNYTGYIGLEYFPIEDAILGLSGLLKFI